MLHIIYPGEIWNDTKHGALQVIKGQIEENTGIWLMNSIEYYVSLPYDDNGRVVMRQIENDILFNNVDWNKVKDTIAQEWKENKIGSDQVENMPLNDLLAAVGVVEISVNPNVVINGQPQVTMDIKNEFKSGFKGIETLEVIDITEEVQDIIEIKEE